MMQTQISDQFSTYGNSSRGRPLDSLFIYPTSLYADSIKKKLADDAIPHNPDRYTTLTEFCVSFHGEYGRKTRLLSKGQQLIILSQSLENIREQVPFFFSHGYPSSGTLEDLISLRNIISQRAIEVSSHPLVASSEKCRQIFLAIDTYLEVIRLDDLLDSSALIEWTSEQLLSMEVCLYDTTVIYGLFDLFPREQALIRAIRDHSRVFRFEYPSGDDPALYKPPEWIRPEELSPAGSRSPPLRYSSLFTPDPVLTDSQSLSCATFHTGTEEIEQIAEKIHELYEKGVPLSDIAVAFPDISSYLPLIRDIFTDFGISWHANAGEPLIREPLVSFLLLIPSLVIDDYPWNDVYRLISSPYFAYHGIPLSRTDLSSFDLVTRLAGIEGGGSWDRWLLEFKERETAPETREMLRDDLSSSIDAAVILITEIQEDFNRLKEDMAPGMHGNVLREICTRWILPEYLRSGAHGDDLFRDREIRSFYLFCECLTRASSGTRYNERVRLMDFLKYLTFLLNELVNLSDDTGGVRIIGIRQAVCMNFSCLFLGGLVEGEIPHPSTRFPLLTARESEQLGSRGLDEVIRGERYYFIAALHAGNQVWLSTAKIRNERPLLSSSFFEQVEQVCSPPPWGGEVSRSKKRNAVRAGEIITSGGYSDTQKAAEESVRYLPADQTLGSIANRILIEDWYRTGALDSVYDGILTEDTDVTTWLSQSSRFGKDRIWSPTQLETYANCPFRFFLERVIHLKELPESDPTLTPAGKGTLIHDTLCAFFTAWCANGPRPIRTGDVQAATTLLHAIGREQSDRYRYQSPAWYATIASLQGFQDNPGLLDRFILYEAAREGSILYPSWFECQIRESDDDTETGSGGYVSLGLDHEEPIRISGKIDRVDISDDGYFAIIDYKTGSSYPNSVHIKNGTALQLPLYLLALEKMHEHDDVPLIGIGGSYYEISRNIEQKWPLLDPERKHLTGRSRLQGTTEFRQVTLRALDYAREYIASIRRGIFPLTREMCKNASYCEYRGICRFDRFRESDDEDMSGEE